MNPLRGFFRQIRVAAGMFGLSLFLLSLSCSQKLPTPPPNRAAVLNPTATAEPSNEPTDKTSGKYLEAPDECVVEPAADTAVSFDAGQLDYASVDGGETIEKSVGSSGYTILLPIGTKDTARLIIPDGALDKSWNLSLRADLVSTRDEKMSVALYEFFPDGLVYLKDCYLVQPARYPDGTLLVLSWFNPATGKWESESTARVQSGQAVFVIKHFSKYGAPCDGLGSGGQ